MTRLLVPPLWKLGAWNEGEVGMKVGEVLYCTSYPLTSVRQCLSSGVSGHDSKCTLKFWIHLCVYTYSSIVVIVVRVVKLCFDIAISLCRCCWIVTAWVLKFLFENSTLKKLWISKTMLSGTLLPEHGHGMSSGYGWRDNLQIWRVAATILNKQSCIADKGLSSSLWVQQGAGNSL